MSAHGKISLAGLAYNVGATYAGEPFEVVVAGGLVDILHAGVVVATHAQRLREDQADRMPRSLSASRAASAYSRAWYCAHVRLGCGASVTGAVGVAGVRMSDGEPEITP